MIAPRKIDLLVIHCADTPNGKPFTARDIDSWHRERGFVRGYGWRQQVRFNPDLTSIGYHFVIYTDGSLHAGRHPDEVGAHAAGHNAHSIGICMIGHDKYTAAQWATLKQLVIDLKVKHGAVKICGHRDLPNVTKECPGFDVTAWLKEMQPETQHIL